MCRQRFLVSAQSIKAKCKRAQAKVYEGVEPNCATGQFSAFFGATRDTKYGGEMNQPSGVVRIKLYPTLEMVNRQVVFVTKPVYLSQESVASTLTWVQPHRLGGNFQRAIFDGVGRRSVFVLDQQRQG